MAVFQGCKGGMAMMAMMAQNLHQTHENQGHRIVKLFLEEMHDESPKWGFTDYNDSMSSSETKV